jgi:hypothetical protein
MVLPLTPNDAPPQPLSPTTLPVKPAGSASVKPTPVAAASALGFARVKMRVEPLFTATTAGTNALLNTGVGLAAVKDTVALSLAGLGSGGVTAEALALLPIRAPSGSLQLTVTTILNVATSPNGHARLVATNRARITHCGR